MSSPLELQGDGVGLARSLHLVEGLAEPPLQVEAVGALAHVLGSQVRRCREEEGV